MDLRLTSERRTCAILVATFVFLVILLSPVFSAPFHSYGRFRSPREKGCYYLLKHYKNGQQIETNEPCLNCTCVNSMLMCYLRVCPFIRPLGERCIIEKVKGECCPKIICPDVTAEPEPEIHTTTTEDPIESGPGCYLDRQYFKEGAQIPQEFGKPCEICYCIRNTSACVMQECALRGVGGCVPIFKSNSCCPTKYNCSSKAATTVPPYVKGLSKSRGCDTNGIHYSDGEAVPSPNPCEHCYCMRDEVVCAVQECKVPCDGCVPIPSENDQCCPERYECLATTRPVPYINGSLFSTTTKTIHSITETSGITTESSLLSTLTFKSTTESLDIDGVATSRQPSAKKEESTVTTQMPLFPEKANISKTPKLEASDIMSDYPGVHPTTKSKSGVPGEVRTPTTRMPMWKARVPGEETKTGPGYKPTKVPTKRPSVTPGMIPGEGICRQFGKIYQNGDRVISRDPCMEYCMCINSVVYCDEIMCEQNTELAQNDKCKRIKLETECCPKYECDNGTTILTTVSAIRTTVKMPDSTEMPEITSTATDTSKSLETTIDTISLSTEGEEPLITTPMIGIKTSETTTISSKPPEEPDLSATTIADQKSDIRTTTEKLKDITLIQTTTSTPISDISSSTEMPEKKKTGVPSDIKSETTTQSIDISSSQIDVKEEMKTTTAESIDITTQVSEEVKSKDIVTKVPTVVTTIRDEITTSVKSKETTSSDKITGILSETTTSAPVSEMSSSTEMPEKKETGVTSDIKSETTTQSIDIKEETKISTVEGIETTTQISEEVKSKHIVTKVPIITTISDKITTSEEIKETVTERPVKATTGTPEIFTTQSIETSSPEIDVKVEIKTSTAESIETTTQVSEEVSTMRHKFEPKDITTEKSIESVDSSSPKMIISSEPTTQKGSEGDISDTTTIGIKDKDNLIETTSPSLPVTTEDDSEKVTKVVTESPKQKLTESQTSGQTSDQTTQSIGEITQKLTTQQSSEMTTEFSDKIDIKAETTAPSVSETTPIIKKDSEDMTTEREQITTSTVDSKKTPEEISTTEKIRSTESTMGSTVPTVTSPITQSIDLKTETEGMVVTKGPDYTTLSPVKSAETVTEKEIRITTEKVEIKTTKEEDQVTTPSVSIGPKVVTTTFKQIDEIGIESTTPFIEKEDEIKSEVPDSVTQTIGTTQKSDISSDKTEESVATTTQVSKESTQTVTPKTVEEVEKTTTGVDMTAKPVKPETTTMRADIIVTEKTEKSEVTDTPIEKSSDKVSEITSDSMTLSPITEGKPEKTTKPSLIDSVSTVDSIEQRLTTESDKLTEVITTTKPEIIIMTSTETEPELDEKIITSSPKPDITSTELPKTSSDSIPQDLTKGLPTTSSDISEVRTQTPSEDIDTKSQAITTAQTSKPVDGITTQKPISSEDIEIISTTKSDIERMTTKVPDLKTSSPESTQRPSTDSIITTISDEIITSEEIKDMVTKRPVKVTTETAEIFSTQSIETSSPEIDVKVEIKTSTAESIETTTQVSEEVKSKDIVTKVPTIVTTISDEITASVMSKETVTTPPEKIATGILSETTTSASISDISSSTETSEKKETGVPSDIKSETTTQSIEISSSGIDVKEETKITTPESIETTTQISKEVKSKDIVTKVPTIITTISDEITTSEEIKETVTERPVKVTTETPEIFTTQSIETSSPEIDVKVEIKTSTAESIETTTQVSEEVKSKDIVTKVPTIVTTISDEITTSEKSKETVTTSSDKITGILSETTTSAPISELSSSTEMPEKKETRVPSDIKTETTTQSIDIKEETKTSTVEGIETTTQISEEVKSKQIVTKVPTIITTISDKITTSEEIKETVTERPVKATTGTPEIFTIQSIETSSPEIDVKVEIKTSTAESIETTTQVSEEVSTMRHKFEPKDITTEKSIETTIESIDSSSPKMILISETTTQKVMVGDISDIMTIGIKDKDVSIETTSPSLPVTTEDDSEKVTKVVTESLKQKLTKPQTSDQTTQSIGEITQKLTTQQSSEMTTEFSDKIDIKVETTAPSVSETTPIIKKDSEDMTTEREQITTSTVDSKKTTIPSDRDLTSEEIRTTEKIRTSESTMGSTVPTVTSPITQSIDLKTETEVTRGQDYTTLSPVKSAETVTEKEIRITTEKVEINTTKEEDQVTTPSVSIGPKVMTTTFKQIDEIGIESTTPFIEKEDEIKSEVPESVTQTTQKLTQTVTPKTGEEVDKTATESDLTEKPAKPETTTMRADIIITEKTSKKSDVTTERSSEVEIKSSVPHIEEATELTTTSDKIDIQTRKIVKPSKPTEEDLITLSTIPELKTTVSSIVTTDSTSAVPSEEETKATPSKVSTSATDSEYTVEREETTSGMTTKSQVSRTEPSVTEITTKVSDKSVSTDKPLLVNTTTEAIVTTEAEEISTSFAKLNMTSPDSQLRSSTEQPVTSTKESIGTDTEKDLTSTEKSIFTTISDMISTKFGSKATESDSTSKPEKEESITTISPTKFFYSTLNLGEIWTTISDTFVSTKDDSEKDGQKVTESTSLVTESPKQKLTEPQTRGQTSDQTTQSIGEISEKFSTKESIEMATEFSDKIDIKAETTAPSVSETTPIIKKVSEDMTTERAQISTSTEESKKTTISSDRNLTSEEISTSEKIRTSESTMSSTVPTVTSPITQSIDLKTETEVTRGQDYTTLSPVKSAETLVTEKELRITTEKVEIKTTKEEDQVTTSSVSIEPKIVMTTSKQTDEIGIESTTPFIEKEDEIKSEVPDSVTQTIQKSDISSDKTEESVATTTQISKESTQTVTPKTVEEVEKTTTGVDMTAKPVKPETTTLRADIIVTEKTEKSEVTDTPIEKSSDKVSEITSDSMTLSPITEGKPEKTTKPSLIDSVSTVDPIEQRLTTESDKLTEVITTTKPEIIIMTSTETEPELDEKIITSSPKPDITSTELPKTSSDSIPQDLTKGLPTTSSDISEVRTQTPSEDIDTKSQAITTAQTSKLVDGITTQKPISSEDIEIISTTKSDIERMTTKVPDIKISSPESTQRPSTDSIEEKETTTSEKDSTIIEEIVTKIPTIFTTISDGITASVKTKETVTESPVKVTTESAEIFSIQSIETSSPEIDVKVEIKTSTAESIETTTQVSEEVKSKDIVTKVPTIVTTISDEITTSEKSKETVTTSSDKITGILSETTTSAPISEVSSSTEIPEKKETGVTSDIKSETTTQSIDIKEETKISTVEGIETTTQISEEVKSKHIVTKVPIITTISDKFTTSEEIKETVTERPVKATTGTPEIFTTQSIETSSPEIDVKVEIKTSTAESIETTTQVSEEVKSKDIVTKVPTVVTTIRDEITTSVKSKETLTTSSDKITGILSETTTSAPISEMSSSTEIPEKKETGVTSDIKSETTTQSIDIKEETKISTVEGIETTTQISEEVKSKHIVTKVPTIITTIREEIKETVTESPVKVTTESAEIFSIQSIETSSPEIDVKVEIKTSTAESIETTTQVSEELKSKDIVTKVPIITTISDKITTSEEIKETVTERPVKATTGTPEIFTIQSIETSSPEIDVKVEIKTSTAESIETTTQVSEEVSTKRHKFEPKDITTEKSIESVDSSSPKMIISSETTTQKVVVGDVSDITTIGINDKDVSIETTSPSLPETTKLDKKDFDSTTKAEELSKITTENIVSSSQDTNITHLPQTSEDLDKETTVSDLKTTLIQGITDRPEPDINITESEVSKPRISLLTNETTITPQIETKTSTPIPTITSTDDIFRELSKQTTKTDETISSEELTTPFIAKTTVEYIKSSQTVSNQTLSDKSLTEFTTSPTVLPKNFTIEADITTSGQSTTVRSFESTDLRGETGDTTQTTQTPILESSTKSTSKESPISSVSDIFTTISDLIASTLKPFTTSKVVSDEDGTDDSTTVTSLKSDVKFSDSIKVSTTDAGSLISSVSLNETKTTLPLSDELTTQSIQTTTSSDISQTSGTSSHSPSDYSSISETKTSVTTDSIISDIITKATERPSILTSLSRNETQETTGTTAAVEDVEGMTLRANVTSVAPITTFERDFVSTTVSTILQSITSSSRTSTSELSGSDATIDSITTDAIKSKEIISDGTTTTSPADDFVTSLSSTAKPTFIPIELTKTTQTVKEMTTQSTATMTIESSTKPSTDLLNQTSAVTNRTSITQPSASPTTPSYSELEEGACVYDGKIYQSAEQIPRPHPCDFCFCFRGDIICLQQTCPPPIARCFETQIEGFCCPRYECPVQLATMNMTLTTPTSVPTMQVEKKGCQINGNFYEIGEVVKPASGPCLECKCDHSGVMQCDPQECSPQAPLPLRMNRQFFEGSTKR